MYLTQAVLFILYCFNYCDCASQRVWCNKHCGQVMGFTASPKNTTVIFECPVKSKEYHIYVNEFSGPSNMESLIVRNCNILTVLFRCTKYKWEAKRLKHLEISSIETLKIQHLQGYHSRLPPEVVLKDIKLIRNIPNYSFWQEDRLNKAGCVKSIYDFNSMHFRNVAINSINSNAFYMPNKFGNITFTNVTIKNIDTSALVVSHDKDGQFIMHRSTIAAMDPSSFQIDGKRAIFHESNFASIPSSGINATVETFYFMKNSVKSLEPHALSIRATNVFILNNRFESLKAGAFEQIGPRKFGRLNFTYDFSQNDINFMDADCLHPGLIAYQNGSVEISFSENSLSCACDKLGWLLSRLDQANVAAPVKAFYKKVLDEKSDNICSSSCDLPLGATKRMMKDGNCIQNITAEWLCENNNGNTAITSPPPPPLKEYGLTTGRQPTKPPASEKLVTFSTQEHQVNYSTNNKLTTAVVTPSALKAPRHRPVGKKFANSTEVIEPTPTSVGANKLIVSILKNTDASARFELKSSAENHFVSFFLLACHLLCNVIICS